MHVTISFTIRRRPSDGEPGKDASSIGVGLSSAAGQSYLALNGKKVLRTILTTVTVSRGLVSRHVSATETPFVMNAGMYLMAANRKLEVVEMTVALTATMTSVNRTLVANEFADIINNYRAQHPEYILAFVAMGVNTITTNLRTALRACGGLRAVTYTNATRYHFMVGQCGDILPGQGYEEIYTPAADGSFTLHEITISAISGVGIVKNGADNFANEYPLDGTLVRKPTQWDVRRLYQNDEHYIDIVYTVVDGVRQYWRLAEPTNLPVNSESAPVVNQRGTMSEDGVWRVVSSLGPTHLDLAIIDNAYINVAGNGEMFVGEFDSNGDPVGWRINRGAITHTVTGMSLDKDGNFDTGSGGTATFHANTFEVRNLDNQVTASVNEKGQLEVIDGKFRGRVEASVLVTPFRTISHESIVPGTKRQFSLLSDSPSFIETYGVSTYSTVPNSTDRLMEIILPHPADVLGKCIEISCPNTTQPMPQTNSRYYCPVDILICSQRESALAIACRNSLLTSNDEEVLNSGGLTLALAQTDPLAFLNLALSTLSPDYIVGTQHVEGDQIAGFVDAGYGSSHWQGIRLNSPLYRNDGSTSSVKLIAMQVSPTYYAWKVFSKTSVELYNIIS